MRLARFVPNQSFPRTARIGAVVGDAQLVDAAAAYRVYLQQQQWCTREAAERVAAAVLPADTVDMLEAGHLGQLALKVALDLWRELEPAAAVFGEKIVYHATETTLAAPIRPRLLRDFLSFEAHLRNARARRGGTVPPEWYEIPVYYKGNPVTVIGPDAEVEWPAYTEQLDYELELACIIGKGGKDIPRERAHEHIFGYTIMNDFSARDIQLREQSVGLGPAKGKDFATAMGPWIVTPDELGDPHNLRMVARVNGEIWSDGHSSTMYRTFADLVAYASKSELLVPGDVLGSGTVGLGCGLELGRYLAPGDVVELEIAGVGRLRNRVVRQ